jgi:hypothetical protein
MVDINLTPGALVYSAAATISSKEEHHIAEIINFASVLSGVPSNRFLGYMTAETRNKFSIMFAKTSREKPL